MYSCLAVIVLLEYQSGHDSYERYFGLSTDVSEVLHRWAEKHSHFKDSEEGVGHILWMIFLKIRYGNHYWCKNAFLFHLLQK